MRKHILDRSHTSRDMAPRRMIAILRRALPCKASLQLQRRPRARLASQRTANFLRIARS